MNRGVDDTINTVVIFREQEHGDEIVDNGYALCVVISVIESAMNRND